MQVKDFNLKQTLECGQCFNFEQVYSGTSDEPEICEYKYIVVHAKRMLVVSQKGTELCFENATDEDIRKIWVPYFDLDRDYSEIKESIIKADERLRPVIEEYYGIRILNQEFVETLISFIISQNSNIPRIKKTIRALSERYGNEIGEYEGKKYYSFPELSELDKISEENFRELKTGFRALYLRCAVDAMKGGGINEAALKGMSFQEAKERLCTIKGVGDKVANCVLLFGLGFRGAFPVDVWIKRVMQKLYVPDEARAERLSEKGMEIFGEYGGYAQQYLFVFARNMR